MSQTEVQLIKSNSVVDADIVGVSSSKLSGALPALSAANLTNIPAANLTGTLPAISGASFTNLPASGKAKNLIVNGATAIAQRGSSSTSSGYATTDRFASYSGNIGQNVTQSNQSLSTGDTGPYGAGFRKFHRIQLAAAGNANANAYVEALVYSIEAQDIARSGWDSTSSSSNITLSFWFRCSTNQAFRLNLRSEDGTARMYSTDFTASANNTWTKITKTIPGNTSPTVQIDNDNGAGLKLFFGAFYGTDYTDSGSTMNAWKTYSSSSQGTDMASTWLAAGASTFDITGVQLEVGDSATDFEHLSHAEDLAKCQRYHYKHEIVDSIGPYYTQYHSGHKFVHDFFPVTMRAAPSASVTIQTTSDGNNPYKISKNHYKAYLGSSYTDGNSHYMTAASYTSEI